jgi:DNA-methyltransferase (dcm)
MKYGSVCSGIEAASVAWHSLGWEAQWYSEIEHFPSEVLKHRFPDVPNLGDMTQLFSNKTFLDSHIDLLVGGTPCQSFSVAGLRKGMEDPRGNLTLTFLSLIDIKKPKWIVWENVPGIISSNQGKDFQSFLDGLEEIGYICDVEILDAQHFGVAQRRKRVFVCGQSVDSILKERTITSALTIAQCLTEILHGILIEVLSLYEREPIKSDQASLLRDGVMRRMKLFGILTENCNYKNWQELLVDVFLKHHPVQKNWDLPLGGKSQKELTLEDLLMGLNQEGQSTLTEESLRKALEDLYEVMKLYTTLTLTKETIQSKISMFFQAGESISRLIARLSDSSPNSLSATLSSLTLLQELTNYARQTNSNIFSEMAGIYEVGDFLKQAQHRNAVVGYLGDWRPAAAVLFESESLQRDSKPIRKKGQETPADAQGGVGKSGDVSCAGGNVSPTVTSKWMTGYGGPSGSNEAGNMVYEQVAQPFRKVRRAQSDTDFETWEQDDKANTLNCFDQGDVRSTNVVAQPIAVDVYNQTIDGQTSATLTKAVGGTNTSGPKIAQPIAVDTYNYTTNDKTTQTIRSQSGTEHIGAVLEPTIIDRAAFNQGENAQYEPRIEPGQTMSSLVAKGPHAVQYTMAIRRLTPKECERLQGFPDDWTKIPYRNKPAEQCPDGPRYKACGNSMAVPVMRWIGTRIQMIENYLNL